MTNVQLLKKEITMTEYEKFIKSNKKFCKDLISHYYPFEIEFIKKNSSLISWDYIGYNPNIKWNIPFILEFQTYLRPTILCSNPSIQWTKILEEDPKRCKFSFDWFQLSKNTGIDWSLKLIEKYKNEWNYNNLLWNKSMKLNKLELKKIYELSNQKLLNENEQIKEKQWHEEYYKEDIDSKSFLRYFVIEFYKKKGNIDESTWHNISYSESIPWQKELIIKNFEQLYTLALANNVGVCWSFELIEQLKSKRKFNIYDILTEVVYKKLFEDIIGEDNITYLLNLTLKDI
jgi:hypothetical protein